MKAEVMCNTTPIRRADTRGTATARPKSDHDLGINDLIENYSRADVTSGSHPTQDLRSEMPAIGSRK